MNKQGVEFINSRLKTMYEILCIDVPSDHDTIVKFIVEDVEDSADPINWHGGDVDIAFRRFLEFKGYYENT